MSEKAKLTFCIRIYPPISIGFTELPTLISLEKTSVSHLKLLKTLSSTWKLLYLPKESSLLTFLLEEKPLKSAKIVQIKSFLEHSVSNNVNPIKFITFSKMVQRPVRNVLETFYLMFKGQNVLRAVQLKLHKRFQLKVRFNTNKTKLTPHLTQTKLVCLQLRTQKFQQPLQALH